MYIVSLTYTAPLESIDRLLEEHVQFLHEKYDAGVFIASGRKVPRTGGIILARGCDMKTLQQHLAEDPFHREQVATYEITEFAPTMTAAGFETLKE
ncbi:YciI family protein [Desulfovibrio mangrovi]|uniref:YciI family protein n=1 Tax=Desulfovibrio mangrovi TaxID=2976983 RepID=UPI002246427B|nr:YciI family protein [Desulfovibrio mangrovi]UZP67483.1 YciI family protein [Desulfovibrio mangrovi]